MRPNRLLALALLRRATALWAIVRLVFTLAVQTMPAMSAPPSSPIFVSGSAALALVVLGGALGALDCVRHREWVLFGNMGLPPTTVIGLLLAPALCAEVLIQIIDALTKAT